jgi:cysteine desulfuration protein SufE
MATGTIANTLDALAADFDFLDDWEARFRHVIDLGKALPELPEDERTEDNRVRGCVSQVWLVGERDPADRERLIFRGDSDAHIVRGLVAIALQVYSGRSPAEILTTDPQSIFTRLGLGEALTPQRSNGLNSLIERIRIEALVAAADAI